ncbi:MAG: cold shock domain-containing protein [Desulfobacterales bacterium]|nr:cold shock domain-containing protein [Desulfobacterales bacterium]MDD3082042.1 cold shock domain-containing protein [Desulfobacterales bacterium]MDD3951370.1 cold shock domain-containing protein [Desulfobacterales bacterium]MDD4463119.1 cold shock domain-containing protein [Desulfobacterales bacterium]MDY0377963.1 cold shock domain-containing protein [Desulfobacterales bacterium]
MLTGTVKWFNPKAGYGHIKAENGEDIYVHISNVHPYDVLHIGEGDPVRFELRYGIQGVEARNVAKMPQNMFHSV